MSKQDGHITTYTKEQFSPITPKIKNVHIQDIAHALSLMTRANGHFPQFYSVAQHSVDCAKEAQAEKLSDRIILACLLHDASEAYLSDITRPVKVYLGDYADIEKRMQNTIYEAFHLADLSEKEISEVKRIDDMLLYYEFLHFMDEELYAKPQEPNRMPSFSFKMFDDVEKEFLQLFEIYAKKV